MDGDGLGSSNGTPGDPCHPETFIGGLSPGIKWDLLFVIDELGVEKAMSSWCAFNVAE